MGVQINIMNSAQNTSDPNDQKNSSQTTPTVISTSISKEQEGAKLVIPEVVSDIAHEVELPKEVEKAGVEIIKDTIELPPDIKKLGVTASGPTTPVAVSMLLPQVALPISDPQIVAGLHAQIISSLRWLAIWCVKRLKTAHIKLKEIHGKVIRVKE